MRDGVRGTVAVVVDQQSAGSLRRLDPEDLGDHLDRLYRAAWALSGSREDAEDLVQETYVRVLARPRWLRGDDDLGYLLRALRNTYVSRARSGSARPRPASLDERLDQLPSGVAAGQPERAAEVSAVFAAIAQLPDHYRLTIVAVDVAGLTYAQAARALRVREATITTRLHRARASVARTLGDAPQPLEVGVR